MVGARRNSRDCNVGDAARESCAGRPWRRSRRRWLPWLSWWRRFSWRRWRISRRAAVSAAERWAASMAVVEASTCRRASAGGGFHGGGARAGGFHTIHAAPHAATRIGRGGGARQFRATRNPAVTHNPAAGNPPARPATPPASAAAMGRNARAVGRTLSSRPIAAAMHRPGGLREPDGARCDRDGRSGSGLGLSQSQWRLVVAPSAWRFRLGRPGVLALCLLRSL